MTVQDEMKDTILWLAGDMVETHNEGDDTPPAIHVTLDEHDDHIVLTGQHTDTGMQHTATVTIRWSVTESPDHWEVRTTTVQDGVGEDRLTEGTDLDYLDSGKFEEEVAQLLDDIIVAKFLTAPERKAIIEYYRY